MLAQELTKILKRKPAILDRLRRPKTTRRLFTDLSGFLTKRWPQYEHAYAALVYSGF